MRLSEKGRVSIMAQKRGLFGITVEDIGSLPVIIKDKESGEINEEETYRVNKNNKFFQAASENNAFTLGKLANFVLEQTGTDETGRTIRAARKTAKIREAKAKGGYVKKYAKGSGVRKVRS
jgi:hypothetical protein